VRYTVSVALGEVLLNELAVDGDVAPTVPGWVRQGQSFSWTGQAKQEKKQTKRKSETVGTRSRAEVVVE
jgi:hypothetical protein